MSELEHYLPNPSTFEDLVAKAAKTGRQVVRPLLNQIFIDLDSQSDLIMFMDRLETFKRFESAGCVVTTSQTDDHYHAIVTLDREPSPWERVALQAALGSDRKRELLAIINRVGDMPGPNCFFEALTNG